LLPIGGFWDQFRESVRGGGSDPLIIGRHEVDKVHACLSGERRVVDRGRDFPLADGASVECECTIVAGSEDDSVYARGSEVVGMAI